VFEEADLIHRESRSVALRDGALIGVSATAKEAGIRWHSTIPFSARLVVLRFFHQQWWRGRGLCPEVLEGETAIHEADMP
jgi:hypothetical protein